MNSLGNLEGNKCNDTMNLNFDEIWYQFVATENEKLFGCSAPWFPTTYSQRTKKQIQICNNSTMGLKATNKFRAAMNKPIASELAPCANFDIYLDNPDIDDVDNNVNEEYIRMYANIQIKENTLVLQYDIIALIAEMGGYTGILLGISILNILTSIDRYVQSKVNVMLL